MYYSCRFYIWVILEVIKFRDGAFSWRELTELEENVSILLFCLLQEQGEFGALILGCVEYWVHCTWNHLFFTCDHIVFTYSFICPFSQQIFNTMCQVLFWMLNITVNKMDSAAAKSLQSCLTLDYNPPLAPLSLGFSRQEYWSGLPCPPSRGSSWPRDWTCVSLSLLHWQMGSSPLVTLNKRKTNNFMCVC